MYNKRLMTKNNVENLIYKLLMNSLYGRFGINKNKIKTKIIDKKDI
jgi:hypothetical protein